MSKVKTKKSIATRKGTITSKEVNPFTKAKQLKRKGKSKTYTAYVEPGKISRTGATSITRTKKRGQQGTQSGATAISRKKLPIGTRQTPSKAQLKSRNKQKKDTDKIISAATKVLRGGGKTSKYRMKGGGKTSKYRMKGGGKTSKYRMKGGGKTSKYMARGGRAR